MKTESRRLFTNAWAKIVFTRVTFRRARRPVQRALFVSPVCRRRFRTAVRFSSPKFAVTCARYEIRRFTVTVVSPLLPERAPSPVHETRGRTGGTGNARDGIVGPATGLPG